MAILTGQSCRALVTQALLVDYIFVQSLSSVAAVVNLFGPMMSLRTGR
jgi:hypothetical protein